MGMLGSILMEQHKHERLYVRIPGLYSNFVRLHQRFDHALRILGPVKDQGIDTHQCTCLCTFLFHLLQETQCLLSIDGTTLEIMQHPAQKNASCCHGYWREIRKAVFQCPIKTAKYCKWHEHIAAVVAIHRQLIQETHELYTNRIFHGCQLQRR